MNATVPEVPNWRLTTRLADKKGQKRLFEKLDIARSLFPELKGCGTGLHRKMVHMVQEPKCLVLCHRS
jgi:hypothetical protein